MNLSHIIREAIDSDAIRDAKISPAASPVLELYEALVGIGTAARACDHLLRRDALEVAELRAIVKSMIEASNVAIAIVRA